MILESRIYTFKNGKMKLFSKNTNVCNRVQSLEFILRWYRKNKYAKRVATNWICSDYRVDQQRPQRNVYSEAYIKVYDMTKMEEKFIDNLIEDIEKDIEYPTVWDDGENWYYEETIYCPKCGKRRKVLTSETHCEECGFRFEDAIKCPECGMLNLKGSDNCKKCHYTFRKESFIINDEIEIQKNNVELVRCPECGEIKSKYFNTCQNCGFDYDSRKECPSCGEWVDNEDKFCHHCGTKLEVYINCPECSGKNNIENNYCNHCGTKIKK